MIALTAMGIKDVQVVSSVLESRRIAHNIPLFTGFKEDMLSTSAYGRLVLAVVNSKNTPEDFRKSFADSGNDFLKDDFGSILLLPVEKYFSKDSC